MIEYLYTAFSGPPLFASVLLTLVTFYWLLVIVGFIDLEGMDADLDIDLGADMDVDMDVDVDANVDIDGDGALSSILSIGAVPLRWLNVGRVPLMLWISAFALAFWLTSMLWDSPAGRESGWNLLAVLVRNGAIALLAAKVLTQPMCDVFTGRDNSARMRELMGRDCLTTTRVTEERGQAKVEVESAAPLLLSVRLQHGSLEKGERAEIVSYDSGRNVYIVRRAKSEV